jgi:PPM family protein phosphatase
VFRNFKKLIKGNPGFRHFDAKGKSNPSDVLDRGEHIKGEITRSKFRVASCQSTGRERAHNEDTILTLNCFLSGCDSPAHLGIYLVADGMGGHQSGEVASNLAAQGSSQYLMERVYSAFVFEHKTFTQSEIMQFLIEAVGEAQSRILQRVPGGGTTLTMVLALDANIFLAHVGDSRLYLVGPDGVLTLKTRDHSLVKRLIDLGEITESDAVVHPHRNVLYRALGQSDPFEPDTEVFSMQPGERLLLCSDGLWGVVKPEDLTRMLNSSQDLDGAACELVKAANDAGGPDNISVILVERLK